jgi:hypothetical protein
LWSDHEHHLAFLTCCIILYDIIFVLICLESLYVTALSYSIAKWVLACISIT